MKFNLLQRFYAADLDQRQLNEITELFEGRNVKTKEPLAKLFVIPECFYRGYGFSSS